MIGQTQIIVAAEACHVAVSAQLHGGVHGTLDGLQQFQLAILLQLSQDFMSAALEIFSGLGDGVAVGGHGVLPFIVLNYIQVEYHIRWSDE